MPKTRHWRCVRGGTWRSRNGGRRGRCGGSDCGASIAPPGDISLIRLGFPFPAAPTLIAAARDLLQRHVERGEAAQEVRSLVAQWGVRISQTEMRKAFEHARDRNRAFHAGKRRADAIMDSFTEGEMVVGVARDVERLGIGKMGWVAIGGRDNYERKRFRS